jgi:hypothetical protein
VILVLTVVAYAVRHGGLPVNGLFFDDSWVAAGAIHGHFTNIMTVGSGQPGYTALLMAWHDLGSGSLHSLALPALAMGTITPAVLYLSLRSFGYRRSICALLAAAAVVASVDILYSGRVKPYTFDPVLVLCVGVAIPWLAGKTWRWPLAIGWTLTALVLGSFSGYVLVATAAAGIVLFLHPIGDRLVRGCAVGAQAVGQLGFYIWAQRSTDLAGIENTINTGGDAHLHFYVNPIRFGSEFLTHLARIAWVYPGGGDVWLKVFGLLAIAGLIVASVKSGRRNELLPARYLLLMMTMALVGALAGKFPFGPTVHNLYASNGRYMLWSLPAMAVGLAALLQRARDAARDRDVLARAFDVALIVIAVLVLVDGYKAPVGYPFPGSASATHYVDSRLGPQDVLVVTASTFAFADSTDLPVVLRPTPTHEVGFTPHFNDSRIHSLGEWGEAPQTPETIRQAVAHARRVFVIAGSAFGALNAAAIGKVIEAEGYTATTRMFDSYTVVIWHR